MSISKRKVLAAFLIALAAAAAYFLILDRDDLILDSLTRHDLRLHGPVASGSGSGEETPLLSQPVGETLPVDSNEPLQGRRPLQEPGFYGNVVDEMGSPIPAAFVSWTPLPAIPISDFGMLSAYLLSSSLATVTDEMGEFHFDTSPSSLGGRSSVVWLTHPNFEALAIPIPSDHMKWIKGAKHSLTRAEMIRARVLEAGRGVDGAIVRQRSLESSEECTVLVREVTTNSQGLVLLHHLPGRIHILAEKGDMSSAPWEGFPSRTITLSLGSVFVVEGVITRSSSVPASTSLTVVCTATAGERVLELARLENLSDRWGPIELAVVPGVEEYTFRLEGPDVIPREERLGHVQPGRVQRIDFEAEVGRVVWFFVVDEEENNLPEATASVRWMQDGRYVETTAQAREDGYIAVSGCAPGLIETSFSCAGYAPSKMDPFIVPEPEPVTHVVVLPHAAAVAGTCTWREKPLQDFELVVWPTGSTTLAETYLFTDRIDGSFELDTIPLGRVSIVAASCGRGMSDALQIAVSPEGVKGIVIDLPDTIRARGRVVDSKTGGALSNARVQLVVGADNLPIESIGLACSVDADGEFEIAGLPRGLALILVTAPEFSSREVMVTAKEGVELDLGLIRLFPRQSLLVRLRGSTALEPSDCVLSSSDHRGRALLPTRAFDSRGEARFESVNSGSYGLSIDLPDGSRHKTKVELVPGKEWTVDIDLSFGGSLSVEVVPRTGEDLQPELEFITDHLRAGGYDFRTVSLDASGKAMLRYLPPGTFSVGVHEPGYLGGERLASARVDLGPSETQFLRIMIGAGDRWLRVVDSNGSPIPSVLISVNLPGSRLFHEAGLKTDESGKCWIQGLTQDRAIFHLVHAVKGYRAGIYVDLPPADEDIVLVLDGNVDTELIFAGRRGPVPGMVASLGDLDQLFVIDLAPTNENGSTVARNFTEGDYFLRVSDSDYIPIRTKIRVVQNGGPQVFQMRKRCRIEIQAREGGLPRANLPIALRHLDTDTTVHAYLEQFKLFTSSTGASITGSDGRLILEGAPEGDYRWVIESEGQELSGTFTAEPGSNTFYVDVL